MGANDVPFMYSPVKHDKRFPGKEFDPKSVTRASWEKPKTKPKKDGPFVSFARHPDSHEVVGGRISKFRPMSDRTKSAIKWLRRIQLGTRLVQVVGALGILVLFILISQVSALTAWVMRITAGVVAAHCVYGAIHHSRPARARTPASSGAYQLFASIFDLATMPLYAFGALAVRNQSDDWSTLINDDQILQTYFVPSLYYTLIVAAGLHLVSLAIGLYLCLVFRRITQMPPDMNPLEDHLTARVSFRHKRNKSSVATYSTISGSDHRLSTPTESSRRSGVPNDDVNRPPSIPFMRTRADSAESRYSKRDSRANLPSQIQPSSPPGAEVYGKKEYVPSTRASMVHRDENFLTYPSVPSRPSTAASVSTASIIDPTYSNDYSARPRLPESKRSSAGSTSTTGTGRQAKFTEAWYTSDSLLDRTNRRAAKQRDSKTYSALAQRHEQDGHAPSSDDESDVENSPAGRLSKNGGPGGKGAYANLDRQDTAYNSGYYADDMDLSTGEVYSPPPPPPKSLHHPNPLRQHPTTSDLNLHHPYGNNNAERAASPSEMSEVSALSEVDPNDRYMSNPREVSSNMQPSPPPATTRRPTSEYMPRPPPRTSSSKPSSPSKPSTPSRPYSMIDTAITGPGAVTGRLSAYTTNTTTSTLTPPKTRTPTLTGSSAKSRGNAKFPPKNRDSSIQQEEGFFVTKPYGDLRAATPPVMVGAGGSSSNTRQVSSGTDYRQYGDADAGGDLGARESSSRYTLGGGTGGSVFGRRNVSGKVAEEGRSRWSRFSTLND